MNRPVAVDWAEVQAEVVDTLQAYLRIDTTNPPGGEEAAARFLGAILEREGLTPEYFDAGAGRVSLRTALRGDGSQAPLMLLNHTDVVPAEAEHWQVGPFDGAVRDGCLWGRGALDMKGMGILELLVLLVAKRARLPLKRDLVFLALADEETGGSKGIEFLDRARPDLLREPEYCLNEGGIATLEFLGVKPPVFACSPAEKGPLWLRLRARGSPGHGSIPHARNAAARLVRALNAIEGWERATTVLPLTQSLLEQIELAGDWPGGMPSVDTLRSAHPSFAAMVTNTVSLTTLTAGVKHNVIPASAEATLDCRLLPGESHATFVDAIRNVINDPDIETEVVFQSESGVSKWETELVAIIREVVHEEVAEALVLPVTSVGFTDSRVLRRHGVNTYGFIPTLIPSEFAKGIHGHDERVPLDSLGQGCRILFEVVRRLAT